MAETNKAKFNEAMNKLPVAMQSPEVSNALTVLADKLPILAETIAGIIQHIAENPWSSIAAVVGGKLAMSVGGSLVQQMAGNALKGVIGRLTAQLGMQAATGAAGSALVSPVHAATAGSLAGNAAGMAKGGALLAGKAGLVGAAAAAGMALGDAALDVIGGDDWNLRGVMENVGADLAKAIHGAPEDVLEGVEAVRVGKGTPMKSEDQGVVVSQLKEWFGQQKTPEQQQAQQQLQVEQLEVARQQSADTTVMTDALKENSRTNQESAAAIRALAATQLQMNQAGPAERNTTRGPAPPPETMPGVG